MVAVKWAGVCARFLLRVGLLLLVAAGSVACYASAAWLLHTLLNLVGVQVPWALACVAGVLLVLLLTLAWFAREMRIAPWMEEVSDVEGGV